MEQFSWDCDSKKEKGDGIPPKDRCETAVDGPLLQAFSDLTPVAVRPFFSVEFEGLIPSLGGVAESAEVEISDGEVGLVGGEVGVDFRGE